MSSSVGKTCDANNKREPYNGNADSSGSGRPPHDGDNSCVGKKTGVDEEDQSLTKAKPESRSVARRDGGHGSSIQDRISHLFRAVVALRCSLGRWGFYLIAAGRPWSRALCGKVNHDARVSHLICNALTCRLFAQAPSPHWTFNPPRRLLNQAPAPHETLDPPRQ